MKYGKLINGEIVYAPKDYKTCNNNIITNFNKSVEHMIAYGFKKIIDEKPKYNPEADWYLTINKYEETENEIKVIYKVNKNY